MRVRSSSFLLASLTVVAACSNPPTNNMTPDSSTSGMCTTGVCAASGGGSSFGLTGQWALRARVEGRLEEAPGASVRLCPNPQVKSATLLMKLTFSAGGQFSAQICDIALPTVTGGVGSCPSNPSEYLGVEVRPSTELGAYLPTITLPGTGDEPTTVGGAWNPSSLAFLAGASLTNPATDPLPSWDVSRSGCGVASTTGTPATCVVGFDLLRDSEMDGRPGVTLDVQSNDPAQVLMGRGFVVLRVTPALSGTVCNSGCVEGPLSTRLDYSFIQSDVLLSGAPLNTATVTTTIPPLVTQPSSFRMLRAEGAAAGFDTDSNGDVTCVEIKANERRFTQ